MLNAIVCFYHHLIIVQPAEFPFLGKQKVDFPDSQPITLIGRDDYRRNPHNIAIFSKKTYRNKPIA